MTSTASPIANRPGRRFAAIVCDDNSAVLMPPIVTSNLLVQGSNPRKTIGTVNTAEFFITLTISATFIFTLGWQAFTAATVGLLIGGVAAAPFGAMIAKKVNPDMLLTFVGVVVTLTSGYGLYRALA